MSRNRRSKTKSKHARHNKQGKHRPQDRTPPQPPTHRRRGGLTWWAVMLFWIGLVGLGSYPWVRDSLGWSSARAATVDSQPPVVEITAPAAGSTLAASTGDAAKGDDAKGAEAGRWRVEVRARVRDDRTGALDVRFRGGAEARLVESSVVGVYTGWVSLPAAGPQTIEVVATDAAGNQGQARIEVQCAPAPAPAAKAGTTPAK